MPRFTQNILSEKRVEELTLYKVYERKYRNATDLIYLYQLCFLAKHSTDINRLNIKEGIENDDAESASLMYQQCSVIQNCNSMVANSWA